jgi:hypothetical protein
MKNAYKILIRKPKGERDYSENLGVDGRITLKSV